MKVATRKDIRKRLLELGYDSLAQYCRDKGVSYRDVVYLLRGLVNGERSEKIRKTREIVAKDFGEEVFPKFD